MSCLFLQKWPFPSCLKKDLNRHSVALHEKKQGAIPTTGDSKFTRNKGWLLLQTGHIREMLSTQDVATGSPCKSPSCKIVTTFSKGHCGPMLEENHWKRSCRLLPSYHIEITYKILGLLLQPGCGTYTWCRKGSQERLSVCFLLLFGTNIITHAPYRQAHPVTSITQTQHCDSGHYPVSPTAETLSHCAATQLGGSTSVTLAAWMIKHEGTDSL